MTWASQAYNPGSNPGDRIFYISSNTDAEKTKRQEDRYYEDYFPKGRRTNTG
jgi:hypothetical protein